MHIVAQYSHKNGLEYIQDNYSTYYDQIVTLINNIDAEACRTKVSREKTMAGKLLLSPPGLNKAYKEAFSKLGFSPQRVGLSTGEVNPLWVHNGFREIDFLKDGLGIEVQFGKYSFLAYDIVGKMVIFNRMGLLNAGIEILPMKYMATKSMSTGIGHFEQLVADLHYRGVADIDIPALVIGVDTGAGLEYYNGLTTE